MRYQNIREEELKLKVAKEYFWPYDCTRIIGNVDFCVQAHQPEPGLLERESLLWAEAKTGSSNIYHSLTQLVLTIGKARTFDKHLPPSFLGAFDGEKIAFVPYSELSAIFYLNDFNWNVTPSNYKTREFELVLGKVQTILEREQLLYTFGPDDPELRRFIRQNLTESKRGLEKTRIDKNNFMVVYNKWCATVKPTIRVDWERAKKTGIIDGDFYLADLLSEDNNTLREKLFVLLKHDHYELDRHLTDAGFLTSLTTDFNDRQVAHTQFWNRYHRPPKQEYWEYLLLNRHLLVPQDVRERKGSYFTPQPWVALSQQYLSQVLGDDWQEEYTIWDCAAGTGNLLAGLTNKFNVWASTLDQADVEVMHERIANGANLLDSHVFQFDFLNDDFSKLPKPLQEIIRDEEKRQKLVVYINPPYAEHLDIHNIGDPKGSVSKSGIKFTKTDERYKSKYGSKATRELFVQFFIRIFEEIPSAYIAAFSKPKSINGSNFKDFRKRFEAAFLDGFLCPSNTFDNVKGSFPISFSIWDTSKPNSIGDTTFSVYNTESKFVGYKTVFKPSGVKGRSAMNDWIKLFDFCRQQPSIGFLNCSSQDFVHQNYTSITINRQNSAYKQLSLCADNLKQAAVYFAATFTIEATWLNDRDQFLFPAEGWKTDHEFHGDCLAFTLFHGQNRITAAEGPNHWLPFTEEQVGAHEKFASHFMTRYLAGKVVGAAPAAGPLSLFAEAAPGGREPVRFSPAAQAVYDAGLSLWRYYHAQPKPNPDASLYDIRAHFQGRNEKGRMNSRSDDTGYTERLDALRTARKALAAQLAPKLYQYGFLK